jgi:hypothetical protein
MQIGGGNILMDRLFRSGCIDATVLSTNILKQAFIITIYSHILPSYFCYVLLNTDDC